jgi:hypothetical protein
MLYVLEDSIIENNMIILFFDLTTFLVKRNVAVYTVLFRQEGSMLSFVLLYDPDFAKLEFKLFHSFSLSATSILFRKLVIVYHMVH